MVTYSSQFIAFCQSIDVPWTSTRKAVLHLLWQAPAPMKAYELVAKLATEQSNVKAPSVYRVLDFFVARGLVHKIDSIQSYALCRMDSKLMHNEILFFCSNCHRVLEVEAKLFKEQLIQLAQSIHFLITEDAIELQGKCSNCF